MNRKLLTIVGAAVLVIIAGVAFTFLRPQPGAETTSPYVNQLASHVRGLSAQEVEDLLEGRGAGYARTAELNSYPGPRHALDARQELDLSPTQVEQIDAVFNKMQTEAKRLGQEIVHREAQFGNAFASKTISADDMRAQSDDLAKLYGQLRATHLQAHLEITPLLTTEQIAKYNQLRGYTGSPGPSTPGNEHNPDKHQQTP